MAAHKVILTPKAENEFSELRKFLTTNSLCTSL